MDRERSLPVNVVFGDEPEKKSDEMQIDDEQNNDTDETMLDGEDLIDEEEVIEVDPNDIIAEWIRLKSKRTLLVNTRDLLVEPVEIKEEELDNKIQEILGIEKYSDIQWIKGKENSYLYSDQYIVTVYAEKMVSRLENDIYGLIANSVRRDSKIYPRPTPYKEFYLAPYKLTHEELANVLKEMEQIEEFKDIKLIYASTNELYIYSDLFLSEVYASSLAEWLEVGQYECQ